MLLVSAQEDRLDDRLVVGMGESDRIEGRHMLKVSAINVTVVTSEWRVDDVIGEIEGICKRNRLRSNLSEQFVNLSKESKEMQHLPLTV